MKKRGFDLESMPRQIMGILITGDRTQEVATIKQPTLILHGEDDQLLQPAHGKHTAATIQGSKLIIFEDMGHNIPQAVLPKLLASIVGHLNDVSDKLKFRPCLVHLGKKQGHAKTRRKTHPATTAYWAVESD